MNIIVCSSRGSCLLPLNRRPDTKVIVVPGGKIKDLTDIAIKELGRTTISPKFVYFIAGLPDTTTKLNENYWMNGRWCRYEEVIFRNSEDIVIKIIDKAAQDIIEKNAVPIFSTIVPCHISNWNYCRLHQHKTSHLLHFNSYHHMQENQLETITHINRYILHLNSINQVVTPKIAKPVFYKRGSAWRFRFGKLSDGVHPKDKLRDIWVKIVEEVLEKNNKKFIPVEAVVSQAQYLEGGTEICPDNTPYQISDSDSDSDNDTNQKRSWRY